MPYNTFHIYIYRPNMSTSPSWSYSCFCPDEGLGPGQIPGVFDPGVAFGIRYAWTGDCCDKRRSAAPCSRENPCCGVAENSKIHQESRVITPILKFLSILSKSWMKYMELWWTLPIFASIPGQPLVLRAHRLLPFDGTAVPASGQPLHRAHWVPRMPWKSRFLRVWVTMEIHQIHQHGRNTKPIYGNKCGEKWMNMMFEPDFGVSNFETTWDIPRKFG